LYAIPAILTPLGINIDCHSGILTPLSGLFFCFAIKTGTMANKTISMEVIKQIGILSSLGFSKKAIARELNLSKNTVKSYLSRGDQITEPAPNNKRDTLYEFFPYVKGELKRPGVTRQILWGEYRANS